ncbi:hypothetical protein BC938DRAFT_484039 [Jimgerdemannia flammicorona]|uniref:Uncharacterized protein n=1 Tax=Jimgerdemannia flammicorona TaxID=994334 RepID=A0A433QAL9_9FUNG|nr:hypothetical protein BC938DRAFT_484039 [Jimgerdemannia flammicorona]
MPSYQQVLIISEKVLGLEHSDMATSQLPPRKQTPAMIHYIGYWQEINSTIKRYCQRGMKKIREQHYVYGHVGIMDEYNTSKICLFCFSQVVLHWTHQNIDGRKLVVCLNGAIECVHPWCPARRIKYMT